MDAIVRINVGSDRLSSWGITANDYEMDGAQVDFQDLLVNVSKKRAVTVEGEINPLAARIRSRNTFLVRVKAPISDIVAFKACTEVIVNPRIFPGKLKPGANTLTFKATSGRPAKVCSGAAAVRSAVSPSTGWSPAFSWTVTTAPSGQSAAVPSAAFQALETDTEVSASELVIL